MPSRCASSGVAMMPPRMPRYIDRVPSPEAVARSPGGNQRAASFVMAPRMNGWPIAMTICPANTRGRLVENNPRPRQPIAVSAAPMPTAGRKPQVSMAHAAGRNITTYTAMNTSDRRPMTRSEVPQNAAASPVIGAKVIQAAWFAAVSSMNTASITHR